MTKKLSEAINTKYQLLTEEASYTQLLIEAKEGKTEKDFNKIASKILFTSQNIRSILDKNFTKKQVDEITENLVVHFITGMK